MSGGGDGPAIRVDGVTKRFGNHVAVSNFSFEVPRGVIYGVLGPNGAGKSTTLRMINDIIAPDDGTIRILGEHRPGRDAAPHIGYLPEERGLYPKMRVADMLAFMAELRGLPPGEAKRARPALAVAARPRPVGAQQDRRICRRACSRRSSSPRRSSTGPS